MYFNPCFLSRSTREYTETHAHVSFLEGKSSRRLGIDIHATAKMGGELRILQLLTLEISVRKPVRIFMRACDWAIDLFRSRR